MSILGNIIWFIFGGFLLGLVYIVVGLLFCLTVIGIPFGYQLMKLGVLAMLPFGRTPGFTEQPMGCLSVFFNVLWLLLGGIEITVAHLVIGAFFCLTVIGIPFGLQHFKLARLALLPFGQGLETK